MTFTIGIGVFKVMKVLNSIFNTYGIKIYAILTSTHKIHKVVINV